MTSFIGLWYRKLLETASPPCRNKVKNVSLISLDNNPKLVDDWIGYKKTIVFLDCRDIRFSDVFLYFPLFYLCLPLLHVLSLQHPLTGVVDHHV